MPRKSKTPTRLRTALIAATAAAGLIGSGLAFAGISHADHDGHFEVPSGDGEQFVWPVSAWISADDHYADGSSHSGSADLSVPLGTPVYPARHGEVQEVSQYTQISGYRVQIGHETDDGDVYVSSYTHLAEEPLVEPGQSVDLDTPIGYNGRLGNANMGGPHVHFTIRKEVDGELTPIKIPDIAIEDWVESGEHIPGIYEGLDTVDTAQRSFDVEVTEEFLNVYETTDRTIAGIITSLDEGDEVTVQETAVGQYRVEVDGELGWIPLSGVRPAGWTEYGVEVHASNSANIRSSPDSSSPDNIIGVAADGSYLTAYESDGNWRRVLWQCSPDTNRSDDADDLGRALGGCPGLDSGSRQKYGWIGPDVTEEVSQFQARTRLDNLAVFGNEVVDGEDRPDTGNRIGDAGDIRSLLTVLDTRNGWYRIDHDGQTGWVRGWHTAGRQ